MRVLVVKLSSLGDVIHTLPALSDATRYIKDIHFDWLIEQRYAEIPRWHAQVTDIIPVQLRYWLRHPLHRSTHVAWRAYKARMAGSKYNCLIDAQGLLKSALLSKTVSASSYGLDYHSAREPHASFFYLHKFKISKTEHAIERTRQLFANVLGYPVPKHAPDYSISIPEYSDSKTDVIMIHGTAQARKKWPLKYWCQLARIVRAHGHTLQLPWGNESEHRDAQIIAGNTGSLEVLPKMHLNALAAKLNTATAIVSVDTGPGHLAAALGKSMVTLYGPTDPSLVGTRGQGTHKHLSAKRMNMIHPNEVWTALRPLLATV